MSREKPDDQVVNMADVRLPWPARLQVLLTGRLSVRSVAPIDLVEADGRLFANAHPGTLSVTTRWPFESLRRRPGMELVARGAAGAGEEKA